MKADGGVLALCLASVCLAQSEGPFGSDPNVAEVASAMATTFNPAVTSITILQTKNPTWQERREIFLVLKSLSLLCRNYVSLTSFFQFKILLERQKMISFRLGMSLVFGWHANATLELSKLSREISLSRSKWLLYLKTDTSPEEVMENLNVELNAEAFAVRKTIDREIQIVDGYKIVPGSRVRVGRIGFWKNGKIELVHREPILLRRNDLKGLRFRVTAAPYLPVSMPMRMRESAIRLGGIFGMVYNELSALMNFTSEYVHAVHNISGALVNGTWNGLVGMLHRNETEIILGPIYYRRKILNVASMLKPLMGTFHQIFFKASGRAVGMGAIFSPFSPTVWVAIAMWLVLGAAFLSVVFNVEYNLKREDDEKKHEFYKMGSLFFFWHALCNQSHYSTPMSATCRICFITAYLTSIVLLTSYSAVLISNLALEPENRLFDSLETLLEKSTHRLLVVRGTSDYTYFSAANDTLRRNIFEKLIKVIPAEEFPHRIQKAFEKLCEDGSYAFFTNNEIALLPIQNVRKITNCRILHFSRNIDRIFMSIATHKRSPFLNTMNYYVQKMAEAGLIKRMRSVVNTAIFIDDDEVAQFSSVTFDQVLQNIALLAAGMLLSFVVMTGEIIFFKYCPRTGKVALPKMESDASRRINQLRRILQSNEVTILYSEV